MGIFFISIIKQFVEASDNGKFPSPIGIFFISIQPKIATGWCKSVSVPYEDLFYFYHGRDKDLDILVNEFPSPMGIFFISILINAHNKEVSFVSVPYGDLFYFYPVLWKPYGA